MIVYYNKNIVNNNVVVVNYSNELYTTAQKRNVKTALEIGLAKKVISYSNKDIDEKFYSKNKYILEQHRGGGYWLWKPYIIKKALLEIEENEILFYCDSGSVFVNSIDQLIESFDNSFDIMPFELQYIEKHWTKRDCFYLMGCDEFAMIESKQIQATFSLWRKTSLSINFIDEWLKFAKDYRILIDVDNQFGLSNYDGYIEHRHDQSIFSLLIKKYKIKVYRDPSQNGNKLEELYIDSKYPQILVSTRQKNISFFKYLKKKLSFYLPLRFTKFYRNYLKKFFLKL